MMLLRMPRLQRHLSKHLGQVLQSYTDAYTQRMYEADARDAPCSPLFHYTTWAGFEGIMRSRSFWFTSIEQMNDATELTYGFSIAARLLQMAMFSASGTQPADWLVRKFCEPLVQPGNLAGIRGRFEFYSASFGQADEPHQWEEYGDHRRGIAIGLSERLFTPTFQPHPAPHEQHFMAKVVYEPARCEAQHRRPIQHALDTLTMEAQRETIPSGTQAAEFCRRLASEMHIPIIWNSITTKERKWEPERETRLIALNDRVRPKLPVRLRPVGGQRYVVIPLPLFEPGIVTEVMVGPDADANAETIVGTLLQSLGMPTLPRITRSAR